MKCWIILGIIFALSTAPAHQVGGAAITTSPPCPSYPPPNNGALSCGFLLETILFCQVHCNDGYDFESKPPSYYICDNGKWSFLDLNPAADFAIPWPDCIEATPSPPPTPTY